MANAKQLDTDIQFLAKIQCDVLDCLGPMEHTQACDQLLRLCQEGNKNDYRTARERIGELTLKDIRELIKSLALRFHLPKQAQYTCTLSYIDTSTQHLISMGSRPVSCGGSCHTLDDQKVGFRGLSMPTFLLWHHHEPDASIVQRAILVCQEFFIGRF